MWEKPFLEVEVKRKVDFKCHDKNIITTISYVSSEMKFTVTLSKTIRVIKNRHYLEQFTSGSKQNMNFARFQSCTPLLNVVNSRGLLDFSYMLNIR